ncbi:MAG: 2-succinyl-6-hydroxy-2,4-cyclohexadiene-1-carboxylate synthase [Halomonas sp.]|nr:2-succinyl-6-hydroxy-2,4-cyclohexadiene-1-carboxylate synthase [Halomonas sp.]
MATTTLVLLHGFMGRGNDWNEVIKHLPPAIRCLAPDLPGHGDAPLDPADEHLPFDAYCERVWAGLTEQLPEHIALAGYSMGGRIAAWLAVRHPERVNALILEGAHPGLASSAERQARLDHDEAWARRLEQGPWPDVLEAWYRQPVFASLDDARRRAFIAARASQDPRQLARVLRAASLGHQPALIPGVAALGMPCRFIAGRRDEKFCALGERWSRGCPGLELVKLDGLGHNCHAEAPKTVAYLIHRTCRDTQAVAKSRDR